jgi:hypothetical protein
MTNPKSTLTTSTTSTPQTSKIDFFTNLNFNKEKAKKDGVFVKTLLVENMDKYCVPLIEYGTYDIVLYFHTSDTSIQIACIKAFFFSLYEFTQPNGIINIKLYISDKEFLIDNYKYLFKYFCDGSSNFNGSKKQIKYFKLLNLPINETTKSKLNNNTDIEAIPIPTNKVYYLFQNFYKKIRGLNISDINRGTVTFSI